MPTLALAVALAACASNPPPSYPVVGGPPAAAPAPAAPAAPIASDAVVGDWTGDWGRLVLRADQGRILGV